MGVRAKIQEQKPALVHGMAASVYHADPCPVPSLTASIAHVLCNRSPRHAWELHPKLGGKRREPTAAMDFGTVVHALLLGQEQELVPVQADDWRTAAARELRDAARRAGQCAVLTAELETARAAVKAIKAQLKPFGLKLNGKSEVSVFWCERADNGATVQCRGRLDHLVLARLRATIVDLKTCRSAHPRACESHAYEYGYDIQCAAYRSALGSVMPDLLGREGFRFIFAEVDEPYVVTCFEPAGSFRELGERRWRRAINTWEECLRTKKWPGYATGVLRLEAPQYALLNEEQFAYGSTGT